MVPDCDDSLPLGTDPGETDHARTARMRVDPRPGPDFDPRPGPDFDPRPGPDFDPRPGPDFDPVTTHNRGGSRSGTAGAYGDA
ncbi:hypothetical protein C458_08650 [Haloferax sp. ATCC BAA-644]|nr:hypothetical protein C458_08650 [Haloferax sp. ATCC BAA-644]